MSSINFNFHDAVKLKVIKKGKKPLENLFSHLEMEWDYFRVEKLKNADITVYIGKFKPNNKNCKLIDHTYYIKKDYIYLKDSYKLAKWEAEITGFEAGKIKVKINSNLVGYMFFVGYVIEPLLRFVLLQKGYCAIHAGGVVKDGFAHIFPGRGSSGKTTISLHFVANGYGFLGDDHVILYKNKVLPYPRWLHVFNYHMTQMPKYEEELPFSVKAKIKLKYLLYHASGKYAKLFTYLRFKDVFPDSEIVKSSKLKSIIFVIKNTHKKFNIQKLSKKEIVKSLVLNMRMETYRFNNYMNAYSVVFPKSKLANHWERLEKTLDKYLTGKYHFRKLEISDYNKKSMRKILESVERLK